MRDNATYLGIDITRGGVRVVASNGQRSSIAGAQAPEPEGLLELALYGLSLPPERSVYACVAVPSGFPDDQAQKIARAAARSALFDGVFLCPVTYAVARGVDASFAAVTVVIGSEASSVAIVRGELPTEEDQDTVRPILGREARELAISIRCLLKRYAREDARELLERTVVSGDPDEIERIRRSAIERELEAIGARIEFALDPFVAASGACTLARDLDDEAWRRAAELGGAHRRRF
jgi:hypothetical protein